MAILSWRQLILALSLAVIISGSFANVGNATNVIEQKKAEIKNLEKKITEQKNEISRRESQNFSYDNYLAKLQTQIEANANEQIVLKEMAELTALEITDKEAAIKHEESVLRYQREVLASYLRELYRFDRTNKILQLFDTKSFSDFYRQLNFTEILNNKTAQTTAAIKSARDDLTADREGLVNN